jgi:hypothetical protein
MKLLFSMGIGKPGQLYGNKMVFGQGISTGIPEIALLGLCGSTKPFHLSCLAVNFNGSLSS